MPNETRNKFALGALQLAVTLALTTLALYLLLAGKMSAKLLGTLFVTSLIFGLAAYQTRDKWQDWRYWLTLIGCIAIHFVLVVGLQSRLAGVPTAVLGVFGTFECVAVVWILLTVCP